MALFWPLANYSPVQLFLADNHIMSCSSITNSITSFKYFFCPDRETAFYFFSCLRNRNGSGESLKCQGHFGRKSKDFYLKILTLILQYKSEFELHKFFKLIFFMAAMIFFYWPNLQAYFSGSMVSIRFSLGLKYF